jgi:hypothetical protein
MTDPASTVCASGIRVGALRRLAGPTVALAGSTRCDRSRPRPSVWFCSMSLPGLLDALGAGGPPPWLTSPNRNGGHRASMKPSPRSWRRSAGRPGSPSLSEPQVLTLIEVAVGGFQDAMRAIARQAERRACGGAVLMLDFNTAPKIADARQRRRSMRPRSPSAPPTPPADYLGGSRLGHALRARAAVRVRRCAEGRRAPTSTARRCGSSRSATRSKIWPSAGCARAGFDLYTRKGNRPDGEQFGFSVAGGRIRGHVDGIIAGGPEPWASAFPRSGNARP